MPANPATRRRPSTPRAARAAYGTPTARGTRPTRAAWRTRTARAVRAAWAEAAAPVAAAAPRVRERAGRPRPAAAKRACDLLGAAILIALGAVPLALAAAAVAATVPGGPANPLARVPATGLGGRPYRRWLFRTDGPAGDWLRAHRLQGAPQLLNVLRGEMSLVGPRPDPSPEPRGRLAVRPGMTGLWQVGERSGLPWEERALLDLHYVEHHWLGMDLAILARTPRAALRAPARTPARAAGPATLPHRVT
jgi:lipopolysaccharide/colanic/teichoic acid biosynthesis glycosyltransferase